MTAPYRAPQAPPAFSSRQLAYQQAAAWVQMANTLTWTLASAYVLASAVTFGAAINAGGNVLGLGLSIFWISLLAIWLDIDQLYLEAAKHAREVLEKLEQDFPPEERFYTSQRLRNVARPTITLALRNTARLFAIAWLAVFVVNMHDIQRHGIRTSSDPAPASAATGAKAR